jgi:hypothetical protein
MGTIITAFAVLGFIAAIVMLLVYINNRDKKKERNQFKNPVS